MWHKCHVRWHNLHFKRMLITELDQQTLSQSLICLIFGYQFFASFFYCSFYYHRFFLLFRAIIISLRARESNNYYSRNNWKSYNLERAIKKRTDTKSKAKKIKRNNFTGSNAEKSNIAIEILEKLIVSQRKKLIRTLGAPILFSPTVPTLSHNKRDFIIEKQIARHFVQYSECLSNPLTQIIKPFLNSKSSANCDKRGGGVSQS